MKKLMLILVVAGFSFQAHAEATHNGNTSVAPNRTEQGPVKDKSLRLAEFINACMAEPPGEAPVATGTPGASAAQATGGGNTGGGADAARAALMQSPIFQSKCLSCHSSNGKPLGNKSGKDLTDRMDSNMPPKDSAQAKSMTPADKTALKALFGALKP